MLRSKSSDVPIWFLLSYVPAEAFLTNIAFTSEEARDGPEEIAEYFGNRLRREERMEELDRIAEQWLEYATLNDKVHIIIINFFALLGDL